MAIAKTSLSGQKYVDFPYDAEMYSSGEMVLLEDSRAIQNALKLWLYSMRGERMRMPTWGGYITRWLFKPLNEDTAENIQFGIISGLREEFSPILQLQEVNVTPDTLNDCWTIEIRAVTPHAQEEIYVIENIRRTT